MRCLCLPAVQGQLQKWKQISILLKTCFESIYYTGDGSAGACQALISQYGCDLLWDAISCFTQKYATSMGGGRAESLPGLNLIGAFTTAGDAVYKSNLQRYGETSSWATMFTERKLANAACMWAFTGTWDLDMSALSQQLVEDFPIDSTGVVIRGERRFVSFNPTTRPVGLATWNYRLGFMLAAGADLNYYLELKCSNKADCEPRAGFKDGKCDCYGKQEQILPVGDVQGRLKKNDVLGSGPEGEKFITVQAGDSGSSVRYDTAILRWEWIDKATNSVKKGEATKRIGLAGSQAPVFCSFDTFAGAYRCDIGIGNYAGAKFDSVAPKYDKAKESQTFVLGEPVAFDVQITRQVPSATQKSTAFDENTKWLAYEIYDDQNRKIDELSRGVDSVVIPITGEGSFAPDIKEWAKLYQKYFIPATAAAAVGDTDLYYWKGSIWPPDTSKQYYKLNSRADFNENYVIVIRQGKYSIYYTTGGRSEKDPTKGEKTEDIEIGNWGFFTKTLGGVEPKKTATPLIAEKSLGADRKVVYPDATGQTLFEVTFAQNLPDYAELIIRSKITIAAQVACDPGKVLPWKAIFTMYDGSIGGRPNFNQITLDPIGEEEQQIPVSFNVVCGDKAPGVSEAVSREICFEDGATPNPFGCFCGADAVAQKVFNCGRRGTADKETWQYCGYKAEGMSRVCQADKSPTITASVPLQMQTGTTADVIITKETGITYTITTTDALTNANEKISATKVGPGTIIIIANNVAKGLANKATYKVSVTQAPLKQLPPDVEKIRLQLIQKLQVMLKEATQFESTFAVYSIIPDAELLGKKTDFKAAYSDLTGTILAWKPDIEGLAKQVTDPTVSDKLKEISTSVNSLQLSLTDVGKRIDGAIAPQTLKNILTGTPPLLKSLKDAIPSTLTVINVGTKSEEKKTDESLKAIEEWRFDSIGITTMDFEHVKSVEMLKPVPEYPKVPSGYALFSNYNYILDIYFEKYVAKPVSIVITPSLECKWAYDKYACDPAKLDPLCRTNSFGCSFTAKEGTQDITIDVEGIRVASFKLKAQAAPPPISSKLVVNFPQAAFEFAFSTSQGWLCRRPGATIWTDIDSCEKSVWPNQPQLDVFTVLKGDGGYAVYLYGLNGLQSALRRHSVSSVNEAGLTLDPKIAAAGLYDYSFRLNPEFDKWVKNQK